MMGPQPGRPLGPHSWAERGDDDARLPEVRWPESGLLPVIMQHAGTGEVLQLAYANAEALSLTQATGRAHFYSRSRQEIWERGKTSGISFAVREIRLDCDGDALLYLVDTAGPACHTGERSCFFTALAAGGAERVLQPPARASQAGVLLEVWQAIKERQRTMPEGSYVRYLLSEGIDKIGKKIGEEAAEVIIAGKNGVAERTSSEVADLWFHSLVLLAACGVAPDEVFAQLERRQH
jgi:phosphoribosyl-ATP pyrophosphohydrolase/phosphoribosyl-AMP cyclohydrolase